jgi:hypothetical protein
MAGNGATSADGGAPVLFSYAGVRTIAVKGGATGQVYRFAPGTSIHVQGKDAASMREIPGLSRLDTRNL